jgi:hypothetical protein
MPGPHPVGIQIFTGTSLVRSRVSVLIASLSHIDYNRRGINTNLAVVMCPVMPAAIMIPVTIMLIIMRMPVRMITVIIMPVIWPPGMPVCGIIAPVPVGTPDSISRSIDEPDNRPGSDVIIGGGNYIYV